MVTMPVDKGFVVTSGFGSRWGTTHWGTDYGRNGGSGGHPVYAVKDGVVTRSGPATGFGSWINVDHPAEVGGGLTVYGHIIPELGVGTPVHEGQRIGRIHPTKGPGNGNVDPHLHFEWHRFVWSQPGPDRLNPEVMLAGARWPGDVPAPAPSRGLDAAALAQVMGCTVARAATLLPDYIGAMRAAEITNTKRAAMWAAQLGHESVGLVYMEEIASGAAYEGRRDLGNVYAGDGVRYKGRGPIQLTGRNNYGAFSRWAHGKGFVNSPTYFVDNPHKVSEPKWGFLAASYYWTVARPQINGLADRGDLEGVTRAINGGLNGLADRRTRYNRALGMGDRLLPPNKEDILDMDEAKLREIIAQEVYNCLKVFVGPIGSDVKDVRQQLTGGRNKGEYPGFPQIDNRTFVDALAKIGVKLDIEGFEDIHGGSLKEKQEKEPNR